MSSALRTIAPFLDLQINKRFQFKVFFLRPFRISVYDFLLWIFKYLVINKGKGRESFDTKYLLSKLLDTSLKSIFKSKIKKQKQIRGVLNSKFMVDPKI